MSIALFGGIAGGSRKGLLDGDYRACLRYLEWKSYAEDVVGSAPGGQFL